MLGYLFGNKNVEKILMYLSLHEKAYAMEMSRLFNSPLDPLQKTFRKLEDGDLSTLFRTKF
jgi:hypothetical protein